MKAPTETVTRDRVRAGDSHIEDLARSTPSPSILAVDDEPHMLDLLAQFLGGRTKYALRTTTNSLQVPAILDREKFDLIITDLRMVGMNGLDILRLVREQGRQEEVVIITGRGSLESANEALSLGAFDYITKPFTRKRLIATIARATNHQQTKRDCARREAIFDCEPYNKAVEAFCNEYVNRLATRAGGDRRIAAQRSGLPSEVIDAILGPAH